MGLFISPNRAAVMSSLPPWRRGVGAGMTNTFQNSAQVLSIGIFFSLMIIGLSARLPTTLYHGFVAHGVPRALAAHIAHLPPVTTLFATFLGYNPIAHLLGAHVLAALPPAQAAILTGHGFFPRLITQPFSAALSAAFTFAVITCVLAAAASLLRGGKHDWTDREHTAEVDGTHSTRWPSRGRAVGRRRTSPTAGRLRARRARSRWRARYAACGNSLPAASGLAGERWAAAISSALTASGW